MEFVTKPPTWGEIKQTGTTMPVIMSGDILQTQVLVVLYELYVSGCGSLFRVTVDSKKQKEAADFLGEANPRNYFELVSTVYSALISLGSSLILEGSRSEVGFGRPGGDQAVGSKYQLWQKALAETGRYHEALIGLEVFLVAKQGGTLKPAHLDGFRKGLQEVGLVSDEVPIEDLVSARQSLDLLSARCQVDTGKW